MQINRRITNGLAWAGLFIVVAVPVADAVSSQLMGDRAQIAVAEIEPIAAPVPAPLSQRPHTPVIQTAAVTPSAPAAAKPATGSDPVVDNFLSSGKKLPSYITGGSDAPAQAVAVPAPAKPVVTAPAVTQPTAVAPIETAALPVTPTPSVVPEKIDPVEVATLTPARNAPMPMPLSMRPKAVTQPLVSTPVKESIVVPPEVMASNNSRPLVVDDLQDWESGPLSDFLASRQGKGSSASVSHDEGYYVENRPSRRSRQDRYLGPVEDDFLFPFFN